MKTPSTHAMVVVAYDFLTETVLYTKAWPGITREVAVGRAKNALSGNGRIDGPLQDGQRVVIQVFPTDYDSFSSRTYIYGTIRRSAYRGQFVPDKEI